MTEKELRRLRRQDLLELLVAQSREASRLQTELDREITERAGLLESSERLKGKLDEKDALIEKLKGRLDEKDRTMEEESARQQELNERLKEKLDVKDALIERLKARLNHKDDQIEELEEERKLLQSDRWRELEEEGTAEEVLQRLRALFR